MALSTTYSGRRVYWASQETIATWMPLSTNTAGYFDLATDGTIVCGKAIRGATLLFTTTDVWAMTYIGGDFIFGFARAGNNCGIISQHAVVVLDTGAYWMGAGKFFCFDGFVKTIPCEVDDYVFTSFNATYAWKVWALANPKFGEITWFYPSAVATSCDRYVTYNYLENHWSYGTLSRACGVSLQPGATNATPILINESGQIFDHETGNARTGSTVFLESGPMELGSGDNVVRVQRIVPDDKTVGDVTASLYTALAPDGSEALNGPYTLASQTSVRVTARQVRLRLTESVATAWRVGVVRLGGILGGRR